MVLRRGTETGTRRQRSANRPRVRLISPRPGARVRRGRLLVRWRASDRDGDALTATVDYSGDGGRGWGTVHLGSAAGGRVRLPRALMVGSRRARVRVRGVDDGFNEAIASSGRFQLAAAPPTVRILDPAPRQRVPASAPLFLRGEAFGAGGLPLPARALRWFDGGRPIGRGSSVSVTGLSPGRHRIKLVARQGRLRGSARVPARILAVRPAFLRLSAPAALPRSARRLRLRVASTVVATLRVGRRRFAVGPRSRVVRVRVRRGSNPLTLPLVLRAGRLATTQAITVPRT